MDSKILQIFEDTFPFEREQIVSLCSHNDFPLGLSHVDLLNEIAGCETDHEILDLVRAAYVLHTSYYILLDGVVDNHLTEFQSPIFLTHLFYGANLLYRKSIIKKAPDALTTFEGSFYSHFVKKCICERS